MKIPCEIIVWNVVPMIKKELALKLVNKYGFNQRRTAEKLGTTEATISRYISGKRGVFEIADKQIIEEISKSAEKISKGNDSLVVNEICRICRYIKSKDIIEGINHDCE